MLHSPVTRSIPALSKALMFAACSYRNAKDQFPGELVVTDRWAPVSSRMYQLQFEPSLEERRVISRFWDHYVSELVREPQAGQGRLPDLLIVLDVEPETAIARTERRGTARDNTDNQIPEETRERINAYRNFVRNNGYGIPTVTISTDTQSPTQVAQAAFNAIVSSFNALKAEEFGVNQVNL